MSTPAAPDAAACEAFWQAAKRANPEGVTGDTYRTRAIGNTPDSMNLILGHVRRGDKRGTFSLPWLHAKGFGDAPQVGDYVMLTDFDGKPGALVTTTVVEEITYKTITGAHTAIDGPSVRPLDKWQAVHRPHWTRQLESVGLAFEDDMPVLVENFKLVYPDLDPMAAKVRGLDALPAGPMRPGVQALDSFWRAVLLGRPDLQLPDHYEVRWIGIDAPTTETIFDYIMAGTKVATFRLPWQLEARKHAAAKVGDAIVMIAYDGTPRMAIRITGIEATTFGAIDQRLTGLDGPSVQDVNVWKPLHHKFWSQELAAIGKTVTDDMPVVVERFELIYPRL